MQFLNLPARELRPILSTIYVTYVDVTFITDYEITKSTIRIIPGYH